MVITSQGLHPSRLLVDKRYRKNNLQIHKLFYFFPVFANKPTENLKLIVYNFKVASHTF